ncbi:MAG: Asp-tRNA(Asn)/Glu-tRNA(Gln) amidotransferase GatCAB subunit C, partial [Lachnospiraceae bacterium]|nr:Asp-tRNA(Asn)/Glu-tRNA(Gln) amidotransferase GatCAB subunit C [Lachnospiraceae bacterium]
MDRFGSDKPDTRFGMELCDVSEIVRDCGFAVFEKPVAVGGSVRGINVKGQAGMSRKQIDKLVEEAKGMGTGGLAYLCINEDGSFKSSFAKFMSEETLSALVEAMEGKAGDLLLFAADRNKIVYEVLGSLRLSRASRFGWIDERRLDFLWLVDFPLFEWSDDQERFLAMHHPFTMPFEEDVELMVTDQKGQARAKAYDIVLNGTELGGGSVRIHQDDVQEKMFEALGFSKEEAHSRFGFLLDAFKYGVPPHAGLAYGLDRLTMLMVGADSIRDVIAFPKVKDASDPMTEAPTPVDQEQLEELALEIKKTQQE